MRALAALAGATLALAGPGIAQAAAPSRLLVSGNEFNLVLSRQLTVPGPALIQFQNRGEDPHDLRIRRIGRGSQIRFPELPSGELTELEARLRVGRYRLWCSLPGHARSGMRARLKVKRR